MNGVTCDVDDAADNPGDIGQIRPDPTPRAGVKHWGFAVAHHPVAQHPVVNQAVAHPVANPPRNGAAVATETRQAIAERTDLGLIDDLKTRRQALGWSLGDLADRGGLDPQSLNEWERGVAAPRLELAQRWAIALGLRLALVPIDGMAKTGLVVDWQARRVSVDGTPVRLTPMEWKALERLAGAAGEVVSHRALFRHLYGEEQPYRAQSTAIRVLITKLRRLLPLRIEAQWGKGYILTGVAPPPAQPGEEYVDRLRVAPAPMAVGRSADRRAAPAEPIAPALASEAAAPDLKPVREVKAHPARPPRRASCRAEELGVIERFMAERGVTRCPDVAAIQGSPLPTLVWDKMKRKWVRPPTGEREAV